MQQVTLPLLASYLPLGVATEDLGAHQGRFPGHRGRTWPEHLAWGLDSTASAVRLLLSLQPIGASVIARTQLERWSSNLSFNSGMKQGEGEDTVAWLTRLWSVADTHSHGLVPRVGGLFADLSELLHARGPLMPLVWLDIADVTDGPSSEHALLMEGISEALTVSLSQVRNAIATAAHSSGRSELARIIARFPLVMPVEGWLPEVDAFLFPLVPSNFQQPGIRATIGVVAGGRVRVAEKLRAGLRPEEPPELWPVFGFGEHRFRALATASHAYDNELKMFGEEIGSRRPIEVTATEAVLAGEMAAMLAQWLRQSPDSTLPADAFAVCASGLRSAEWLWLEDDSRSMGCLRCVIEQIARARTWRLRPNRAARIEVNPKSTPRDWVEGAGWRRLSLLNRALGEFAHGATAANLGLARDALVALQHDSENNEMAKYTGLTHALTASIFIVAAECAAWLDHLNSPLGDAYRKVVRIDAPQADRAIEALMNRAWEKRATRLR